MAKKSKKTAASKKATRKTAEVKQLDPKWKKKALAWKPAFQIHTHDDVVAAKERDGDTYGKKSGLKLTHFLNELLYDNFDKGFMDEELDLIVKTEFPKRQVVQRMSAYRAYFNANKHGFGTGEVLEGDYALPIYRQSDRDEE